MQIRLYLEDQGSFEPQDIDIMSCAFEEACNVLRIEGEIRDRKVVAARIIALARNGVIEPRALSSRVVDEVRAIRSL